MKKRAKITKRMTAQLKRWNACENGMERWGQYTYVSTMLRYAPISYLWWLAKRVDSDGLEVEVARRFASRSSLSLAEYRAAYAAIIRTWDLLPKSARTP